MGLFEKIYAPIFAALHEWLLELGGGRMLTPEELAPILERLRGVLPIDGPASLEDGASLEDAAAEDAARAATHRPAPTPPPRVSRCQRATPTRAVDRASGRANASIDDGAIGERRSEANDRIGPDRRTDGRRASDAEAAAPPTPSRRRFRRARVVHGGDETSRERARRLIHGHSRCCHSRAGVRSPRARERHRDACGAAARHHLKACQWTRLYS